MPVQEPVALVSPSPPTAIHSVSSAAHPAGSRGPALAVLPAAAAFQPPASGGVDACAPGIDRMTNAAWPVAGIDAWVTANVPVSDPVDHL